MKESIFMRVLFCKIHCPLMCFCKPSAAPLYTSGPLKLENTPQAPSSVVSVSDTSDQLSGETIQVNEDNLDGKQESVIKSCIRKGPATPAAPKDVEKKKVHWIDNLGRELAEIKEFESSDTGDTDIEEDNRGCVCVIL